MKASLDDVTYVSAVTGSWSEFCSSSPRRPGPEPPPRPEAETGRIVVFFSPGNPVFTGRRSRHDRGEATVGKSARHGHGDRERGAVSRPARARESLQTRTSVVYDVRCPKVFM